MPSLVVWRGAQAGQRFEFAGEVVVGRESSLPISIHDWTISSRHAQLTPKADGVWVTDLASTNGTTVNGVRIEQPTLLKDGDQISLGEVVLTFQRSGDRSGVHRSVLLDESDAVEVHGVDAREPSLSLGREHLKEDSATELDHRLQLLYDVSLAMHRTLDEKALLEVILGKLFEVFLAADRGFILLCEPGKEELTTGAVLHRKNEMTQVAVSRTLVRNVIQNQRGIVSSDFSNDPVHRRDASSRIIGIRSIVCVPMIADGVVLGVIALDSLRSPRAFGKSDMALLVGIAAQAAMALSKARLHQQLVGRELLEKDLALARKIQFRLLPKSEPVCPGWEFRAFYAPAQEVGGDYYDFVELPGDRIGVAIGDVSGKGISGALYMVRVLAEMRYRFAGQPHPRDVLKRLNEAVCEDIEEGMFVTGTLLVVEPLTGRVHVAAAGHQPPLIRRADGSVVEIDLPKLSPLGVNDSAVFSEREFHLVPGETVVIYTDGIPEAPGKDGEAFGVERLVDAIGNCGGTPSDVLTSVLERVRAFGAAGPQFDDVTLVCFGPLVQDERTNITPPRRTVIRR